jgi:hypothetical protein
VFIDQKPSSAIPIGVYAVPLDYEAVEARMVPASDRSSPQYSGLYFSLKTAALNRQFKLVDTDYEKKG